MFISSTVSAFLNLG